MIYTRNACRFVSHMFASKLNRESVLHILCAILLFHVYPIGESVYFIRIKMSNCDGIMRKT